MAPRYTLIDKVGVNPYYPILFRVACYGCLALVTVVILI